MARSRCAASSAPDAARRSAGGRAPAKREGRPVAADRAALSFVRSRTGLNRLDLCRVWRYLLSVPILPPASGDAAASSGEPLTPDAIARDAQLRELMAVREIV